ncbi:MAG: mRNA interferase MazF2 [Gammaproteobacteria bacterium]|nr:MAG: mRNA interferase MazF2 [Gammaproteobacteria bacterium]
MKKGEIWWASLGEPRGSEPGFRRPIVIVSSNAFNDSAINTILAAVITSNTRLADAPGNISLSKRMSKLSKESVINISQIITVDKAYLDERVSKLNRQFLGALDEGLALVMGL